MTIIKQKTKRQQRNEGIAVIAVGLALVIAMAEGVDIFGLLFSR